MSGQGEDQGYQARIPEDAEFATVLLHGCRFRAHRRESYPYDILTVGGGGKHVATVHGDAGAVTDENAACLAASAEMLTALVDLVTAQCRGYDLPWTTAKHAILAGFGAPEPGDKFTSRYSEHTDDRTFPAGTAWQVARVGFCGSQRIKLRLTAVDSNSVAHIDCSLDELRLGFQPEEA